MGRHKNETFNRTKIQKICKRLWFLPFARKFGNNYGKKLMDTARKTGMDAAKTASKRVVQKTAETSGDLRKNKRNRKNLHSTRNKTTNC